MFQHCFTLGITGHTSRGTLILSSLDPLPSVSLLLVIICINRLRLWIPCQYHCASIAGPALDCSCPYSRKGSPQRADSLEHHTHHRLLWTPIRLLHLHICPFRESPLPCLL